MEIRAAVVGLGYWGPNLVRNLAGSTDFRLAAIVDLDTRRVERAGRTYPAAVGCTSLESALEQTRPELVCIATPVASHYALARKALEAGCHVLLEKPLTTTVAEAEEIVALAKAEGVHLFVDHTFLFTAAVQELRRQIASGALGELQYVDGVRINLGLFQPDVDVVWDLAPHDLSILQYLIGRPPISVRAMGTCHNPGGLADVAYLHLDYGAGLSAHLHVSWLSPVKVRRMIIAGSKQSIIYDDLEAAEKIKIYDHGVAFDVQDLEARRRVLVSYRKGEMRAPNLAVTEALQGELIQISAAIRGEKNSAPTGEDGLAVVRVLQAAARSLAAGGSDVSVA